MVQVFVAGATGRLGCRVVLEALRNKKLKERASARNPQEARELVRTATEYGLLTAEQARRLTVVPVDLEDEDSIAPALGNAGKVSIQRVGAECFPCRTGCFVSGDTKERLCYKEPLCYHASVSGAAKYQAGVGITSKQGYSCRSD